MFVGVNPRLDRRRFGGRTLFTVLGRKTAGTGRRVEELSANDVAGMMGFVAGTTIVAGQTAAPTGWTKGSTHNDKSLRLVTGTASSGGTTAFTTVLASKTPAGASAGTALAVGNLTSHTHNFGAGVTGNGTAGLTFGAGTGQPALNTGNGSGGNGSHTQAFTGTARSWAVNYVDVILISKN